MNMKNTKNYENMQKSDFSYSCIFTAIYRGTKFVPWNNRGTKVVPRYLDVNMHEFEKSYFYIFSAFFEFFIFMHIYSVSEFVPRCSTMFHETRSLFRDILL